MNYDKDTKHQLGGRQAGLTPPELGTPLAGRSGDGIGEEENFYASQPPTISSSPLVGGGKPIVYVEFAILHNGVVDAWIEGTQVKESERIHRYVPASRLAQAEEALRERNREAAAATENYNRINALRNEAEAREQRLLTAWEGLLERLKYKSNRCVSRNGTHAYKQAAEWALAALEKGRGGE